MTEDHSHHSLLTEIIISSVQLRLSLEDKFFSHLLDEKIKNFIFSSLNFSRAEDRVAQYNSLLSSTNSILETLDQIEHLDIGNSSVLLPCREQLLKFKLKIIRDFKNNNQPSLENESDRKEPESSPVAEISKPKFPERSKKAIRVREEILDFIKHGDRVRTKDILSQFGALSSRTIKRSLKELINQGLIVRESEKNSTHYSLRT